MKEREYLERWLMGVLRALVEAGGDHVACSRLATEATALIWVLEKDLTWAGASVEAQERVEALRAELGLTEEVE